MPRRHTRSAFTGRGVNGRGEQAAMREALQAWAGVDWHSPVRPRPPERFGACASIPG